MEITHAQENQYGLDIQEAKKSNIMTTGLTGSGKTRLAWAQAEVLMKAGFQVIVIDPVAVWRDSPIPYIVKVTPRTRLDWGEIMETKSVVFDISRLLIANQLEFLDMISRHLFTSRVDRESPKQTMLVIEEASTFVKYLRTQVAQNIYRLAFTGRNYGVRLMYIDPRLNSIPAEFRFLAGQQFHGFANEVNILNKIKRLYGAKWEQVMRSLNVGEFIRTQAGQDPTRIKVPLYQPKTTPVDYVMTVTPVVVQPTPLWFDDLVDYPEPVVVKKKGWAPFLISVGGVLFIFWMFISYFLG